MKMKRSSLIASMAMVGWMAGAAVPANAMLLSLPDQPLILGLQTVPNIFIMMDDSGSMDWEVLTGNHWPTCSYTRRFGTACVAGQYNGTFIFTGSNGGLYQWYYYSDTGDNVYEDRCPEYDGSTEPAATLECVKDRGVNPLDIDWRFASSDLNLMAFNPRVTYQPWTGFSNVSFFGARSNPQPGTAGYGQTENLANNGNGFEFSVWIDNHGFTGNGPDRFNPNVTNEPNGVVDLFDDHVRISVRSTSMTCQLVTTQPNGSSGLTVNRTTLTAAACAPYINNQSLGELQQNIANWYSYARKRSFAAKGAVVDVLNTSPGFRYGISLINSSNTLFVQMPDESVTNFDSHNDQVQNGLLNYVWGAQGTPLRRGLDLVGRYYRGVISGRPSPIVQACQKNFTLLFTDGFWNGSDPSSIADNDGDGTARLLADVAYRYYNTDLRTDLPNEVATDLFDSNSRQHMVTYTIAFGLQTGLVDTDGDGFPDPALVESSPEWWNTSTGDIRKVDDLWHSAFNAKGTFVASQRPEDVSRALRDAIQNIERRAGSAASGATNGGSLNTNSRLYQARFFSDDWHGELLAFDIESDGSLATSAAWDAGDLLDQRPNAYFASQRRVFTYSPTGATGIPFSWLALTQEQRDLMDINPDTGVDDNLGEQRTAYIRGSNTDEGTTFRRRNSRLGDLVSSDPAFVGEPTSFYNFDNYIGFLENNRNRRAMVYAGSNDGMLHGFDADSGQEVFSYVPNEILHKLPELSSQNYTHSFFVDGTPVYSDAQVNGVWRSILAGGLRSGGQGVYALDITDPDSFDANNVLFEFTDEDDPDLGYTFSQPTIARMQNDQWALVFGNGFNSTENDGFASTTGDAVLYILLIDRGLNGWNASDFIKIRTNSGSLLSPNGLGAAGVVDVDGDNRADAIYAGDLKGNLWKFDVSGNSPNSWDLDFGGEPLFRARDGNGQTQPILERPGAVLHPTGGNNGILVTFGTGKFIENSDRTTVNQPTQSVYAIWDQDASPLIDTTAHDFNRAELAEVRLGVNSGFRIRDPSSQEPHWFNPDGTPDDRGWFVDLPDAGERVVEPVLIRSNTMFFVTLIPNDNPCAAGGSGFLIGLDVRNGTVPTAPVFDINGDNDFDDADLLGPDNDIVPIGLETGSIPNLPVVIFDRRSFCERNPGHPNCQGGGGGGGGGGGSGGPPPAFPPPLNSARRCGGNDDRALLYTTQSNGSIVLTTADAGSVQCGRQGWRTLR